MTPETVALGNFQSAFGRLCDLAARALHEGVDRGSVKEAFLGDGNHPELDALRRQRHASNASFELARNTLTSLGSDKPRAVKWCVNVARQSREAVEGEWMVTLPIVNPSP